MFWVMARTIGLYVIILLTAIIHSVYSVCDSSNAIDYVPISPETYDRNYSSITSVDKHPLGFGKSTWYYNNEDHPNPCFKVTGTKNRRLEIMFETFPSSRLCVNEQGTKICSESGTGRLYRCLRAASNTAYLEFTCDSQCGEFDVRFWYRFVIGDSPGDDPEDHWCETRSEDEYPENLIQLPPGYPQVLETTTGFNKAVHLSTLSLGQLLLISLGSLLCVSLRK